MLSIAAQTVIISITSRLDFAHHHDAAARHGTDKTFLFQHRQRLADRRAADAQLLRELALVEADLARVAVDVHVGDGALDGLAGLLAQADADLQRRDPKARGDGVVRHPALLMMLAHCMWYATR